MTIDEISLPPARRQELRLDDGRILVVYDVPTESAAGPVTTVWHHGSPHTGALVSPW